MEIFEFVSILLDASHNDGKAIWRSVGEVKDRLAEEEDERSKPGVQFSPRVSITIHIALPSRIKLLPLPDFHIFARKRVAFTIPTGSRFMKGLN